MAKYLITQRSFLNVGGIHRIVEPGEEIEFSGKPGKAMKKIGKSKAETTDPEPDKEAAAEAATTAQA